MRGFSGAGASVAYDLLGADLSVIDGIDTAGRAILGAAAKREDGAGLRQGGA